MPKQRLLMIVATCLVIIGIAGVLFTYKSSGSAEEISQTEVIDSQDITEITIESDNAAIEVLPTAENKISVDFSAAEPKHNKYRLDIEERGEVLSIELREKALQFLRFDLDFGLKSPKIKVFLPEKQYERLRVDAINGKIIVEDITVTDANVKTVNGRIELTRLDTNTTTVSSENGNIKMEHVDGEITSDLVNGGTTLITDHLDRSIDLESVNGKINIQTATKPTNAIIEVDVVNGKVRLFGNDSRSQVFGDGEHKISLKTVNGGITVE